MTHNEFNHLLHSINALSPDQMRQLWQELDSKLAALSAVHAAPGGEQANRDDLQRRLYEAGLLSEIKPPITDLTPYRHRKAVPIKGEPLSETVIRERR
jgi:hypothetical protein